MPDQEHLLTPLEAGAPETTYRALPLPPLSYVKRADGQLQRVEMVQASAEEEPHPEPIQPEETEQPPDNTHVPAATKIPPATKVPSATKIPPATKLPAAKKFPRSW